MDSWPFVIHHTIWQYICHVAGFAWLKSADIGSCSPLRYEGHQIRHLLDGDEDTCMSEALQADVHYRLVFADTVSQSPYKIMVLGYRLACSNRGMNVIHAPFCPSTTSCDHPYQVCIPQYRAWHRDDHDLEQCLYVCKKQMWNGIIALSKPAERSEGPWLCEIIMA